MHSRRVLIHSLEDVLEILENRDIYYHIQDDMNPVYSIITVEAAYGFDLDDAIDVVKMAAC